MSKSKTRLGGLALAATLALSTAACAAPEVEGEPTTITFSSWQFSEPGRGEAFLALVDEFNGAQSDVIVEAVNTPFSGYSDSIKTQIGAGAGPDVMLLDYDTWVLLQRAGSLLDLTNVVAEPGSGFSPLETMTMVDGKRFGIIWEAVNYALIVNKDLLDTAGVPVPATYEEFKAAAAQLTSGSEMFGFAFRNTMPEEGGWWYDISNWVYGAGGRWTSADGAPDFDSSKVIDAVTRYRDFFLEGYVPQGADAATYRRMFWEGKVAMMIDNNSVPAAMLSNNPELNIVTAPLPFETRANAANVSQLGVNANSKKQDAAIAFLDFVLSESTQARLSEVMVGSSLATPVEPSAEQLAEFPWISAFADTGADALVIAPHGAEEHTARIRNAVLSEMDQVLRGGKDPAAAMRDAKAAVEKFLP